MFNCSKKMVAIHKSRWINKKWYEVAVYWVNEAEYGGVTEHKNMSEALLKANNLRLMGYHNVHVREVRTRVVVTTEENRYEI